VGEDHFLRYREEELCEFVVTKCSICNEKVGEMRVVEPKSHTLKRVLGLNEQIDAQITEGLACAVFKKHLQQVSSVFKNFFDNKK
jgi:hypothetical protein